MQQISVQPGSKFYTPPIILNDPQMPDAVKLVIAIPDGVEIDTNIGSDNNLRCIQMGRDVESMSSWWNPNTREIIVDIKTGIPSQKLELISSIEMTLSPAKQSAQILLNNRLGLSVSAINSIPGDFNKNGIIDLTDLEMFKQKWAYWHQATRSFNPISDSIFDLYPRTIEV